MEQSKNDNNCELMDIIFNTCKVLYDKGILFVPMVALSLDDYREMQKEVNRRLDCIQTNRDYINIKDLN